MVASPAHERTLPTDQYAETYRRPPGDIYEESFKQIRAEADLSHFSDEEAKIAQRIIHACGNTEITGDLVFSGDVIGATTSAIKKGAAIVTDGDMTRMGIIRRFLPAETKITCPINDLDLPTAADSAPITRSALAMMEARDTLPGSVLVIGNAPTALFAVLDLIANGMPAPAVIFAFPVGFVGAAESKEALVADSPACPFVTLQGRLGGSAMASAAVNAVFARTGRE